MRKRICTLLSIVLVFTLSFSLGGCTVIYGKLFVEVKDKNGADTGLAMLSDEDILEEDYDNYCFVYGYVGDGEASYNDGEEHTCDHDAVSVSAQTAYSGVGVIQETYGVSDTIIFTVSSQLTKGNMRIVLLDGERNIIHDFAIGTEDTYEVSGAAGKTFEIRIAAESAEFTIDAERMFGAHGIN